MNVTPENSPTSSPTPPGEVAKPPRLIPSFTAGFNTVANHIYLILLPVALDLFLWFGPHLRLKKLLLPFVYDSLSSVRQMSTADTFQMLDGIEQIWIAFLDHFNLVSLLSTFPVGIPALMAAQAPLQTPLGEPRLLEVNNILVMLGLWLVMLLTGLTLGSLYFSSVAHFSTPEIVNVFKTDALGWQTIQVFLLVVILFFIVMVMFIPAMFITSILTLLSPTLASFAVLGMGFVALWLLIPLVFSPHGIFVLRLNVLSAMLSSARMVRIFLPGTGLFLLITIVLYEGLGALWRTPPDSSWMALVGILGHAFISTALLSASFVYYRGGHDFVLSLRKSANSAKV